jgi:hypothetical protein
MLDERGHRRRDVVAWIFVALMAMILLVTAVGVWNFVVSGNADALSSVVALLIVGLFFWFVFAVARGIGRRMERRRMRREGSGSALPSTDPRRVPPNFRWTAEDGRLLRGELSDHRRTRRRVERNLRRRGYAVLPFLPLLQIGGWDVDLSSLVCGLLLIIFLLFLVGWALGRGWRAGTRRR